MKHTHLFERHAALRARMVPFAGYQMPVSYTSIREEYDAVRQDAGLFDISHMAPFELSGSERLTLLERLTPRLVSTLKAGKMQYNVLLNETGGIADDITILLTPQERLFVIANAVNRDKIEIMLNAEKKKYGGDVQIHSAPDYVLLALQGPQAARFAPLFSTKAAGLYFYENITYDDLLIMRSGYTGEDGFEILAPVEQGLLLWDKFIQAGVKPCGLAARDLLRLEAFYPLYGNELNDTLSPASCNLSWLISENKEYYGRERILYEKENPPWQTIGFQLLEEGVPRAGYEIFAGDILAGVVTSGNFSFLWNCGFGLARLSTNMMLDSLTVAIRGQKKKITLLKKSPLKGSIKRKSK